MFTYLRDGDKEDKREEWEELIVGRLYRDTSISGLYRKLRFMALSQSDVGDRYLISPTRSTGFTRSRCFVPCQSRRNPTQDCKSKHGA